MIQTSVNPKRYALQHRVVGTRWICRPLITIISPTCALWVSGAGLYQKVPDQALQVQTENVLEKCTNAVNNYIIIQLKCKIHYLRLQTQDSRSRPWPWALLAVVLIRILAEVLRSHGLAIRLCLFLLDVGSGFIILCCVFPLFWGSRAV